MLHIQLHTYSSQQKTQGPEEGLEHTSPAPYLGAALKTAPLQEQLLQLVAQVRQLQQRAPQQLVSLPVCRTPTPIASAAVRASRRPLHLLRPCCRS